MGVETAIAVTNLVPRLWIAGVVAPDRDLPGFDVLTLCSPGAAGIAIPFHGQVLRCPLPERMGIHDVRRALLAGRRVAEALTAGRTVLVTCATGRHESALVAGLGIGLSSSMQPSDIVDLIRRRRGSDCLSSAHQQVLALYLRRR